MTELILSCRSHVDLVCFQGVGNPHRLARICSSDRVLDLGSGTETVGLWTNPSITYVFVASHLVGCAICVSVFGAAAWTDGNTAYMCIQASAPAPGLGVDCLIAASCTSGEVVGIDISQVEVRHAQQRAEARGLQGRVSFQVKMSHLYGRSISMGIGPRFTARGA